MPDTAIFDVDGTLVDSDYQHTIAWYRAFRRSDVIRPLWRMHRGIGMGGDLFVVHVAGDDVEREYGDALREAWVEECDAIIGEVAPFEGATELLAEVKRRGFRVVLASSGKTQHVESFLDLIDGKAVADAWATSDDVARSNPAPDLVQAALDRVDGASSVLLGDSTWDCVAAARLGVPTLALRTGGFSPEELRKAGASQVFESLTELLDALDETPMGTPTPAAR